MKEINHLKYDHKINYCILNISYVSDTALCTFQSLLHLKFTMLSQGKAFTISILYTSKPKLEEAK